MARGTPARAEGLDTALAGAKAEAEATKAAESSAEVFIAGGYGLLVIMAVVGPMTCFWCGAQNKTLAVWCLCKDVTFRAFFPAVPRY